MLAPMSDKKPHSFRPPLYHRNGESRANGGSSYRSNAGNREAGQKEGWDAYRKWLSRVSGPAPRRSPLDPAIYSWKGYHNWAEKVKQNWKPE